MVFIGTVVLLLLAVVALVAFVGNYRAERSDSVTIPEQVVTDFTEQARAKVVTELGQPIEGFEPFMFLSVYPGLREIDFDNVDALIGTYRYLDGGVTYDLGVEVETHSAARAISDEGMAILLSNVGDRLQINLETEDAVTVVLAELQQGSTTTEQDKGDPVSLEGLVTCLPHKNQGGMQTLECAIGLEVTPGQFYGLRDLYDVYGGFIDTGKRVRVTGMLVSPEATEKYDIVGVINVASVQEME